MRARRLETRARPASRRSQNARGRIASRAEAIFLDDDFASVASVPRSGIHRRQPDTRNRPRDRWPSSNLHDRLVVAVSPTNLAYAKTAPAHEPRRFRAGLCRTVPGWLARPQTGAARPSRIGRRWPLIRSGAGLPVARTRCIRLTAADGLTAARRAVRRIERPSDVACTIRPRRSRERGALLRQPPRFDWPRYGSTQADSGKDKPI